MGTLSNAAQLMGNPEWRAWMLAAASFVAAEVYGEATSTPNYAARRRLAIDVLTVPDMIVTRLLTLVSVTKVVAEAGPVPSDAHEPLVLARVRELWTPLANSIYPPE